MKVSVIVPVYNVEKYLEKCLDSLVNQTLKDIEIIVVNDESPDDSQKIIDKYKKLYPDKIKSYKQKNGGQGSARNNGLKHATGEYIGYVDSDDWVDLDMYEKMYSIAKNEKSDVVICDMIDHYPNYIIEHNCTKFNSPYEVTPSACNKLFKREIIGDIKFLSKIWYEDFNFTTKILLKSPKISVIHKGFYHCHCREVSTMNNNNSMKNLDMITVIEDIKKYCYDNNIINEELIDYLIFDHILITTINRVAKQKSFEKRKVLNDLIKYCHKNISNYRNKNFYKSVSMNRKIVAYLNYNHLYSFSKLILNIKSILKNRKMY